MTGLGVWLVRARDAVVWDGRARGLGVEGYSQPDFHLPAGDVDVFDQQAQLLPLRPVELVYHFADLPGEVGDTAPEQVSVGEGGALGGEGVTSGVQVAQAGTRPGSRVVPRASTLIAACSVSAAAPDPGGSVSAVAVLAIDNYCRWQNLS